MTPETYKEPNEDNNLQQVEDISDIPSEEIEKFKRDEEKMSKAGSLTKEQERDLNKLLAELKNTNQVEDDEDEEHPLDKLRA